MAQYYIGTQQIMAWPEDQDGEPGYVVLYPNGDNSWSPKVMFEAFCIPMGESSDGTRIDRKMVEDFIVRMVDQRVGETTTVVYATLRNGFTARRGLGPQ